MATESPLIHDGAQTTASTDLSSTGGWLGPSSSAQFLAVYINAARTVTVQTTTGGVCYGLLQNKPLSGAAADVGILGISKAVAGAVCTGGNALMVSNDGRLIPATGTNHRAAFAIEGASTAGAVFTVYIVPAAAATAT